MNFALRDLCKVLPFMIKCGVIFPFEFDTVRNLTRASHEVSKCFVNKLISQMWVEQRQKARTF